MAHDILIVDDEDDIRLLIAGILKDEGYDTREARSDTDALAAISTRQPTLIILDIWLEGSELDGLQILDGLCRDHADVPTIMISGHGTVDSAVQAIKMGAYEFIEKPFKADRLLLTVARAIEAARLRRENEELRLRTGGDVELIGRSNVMSHLRQAVQKVAPTGSRVLISGPPGSGKEVLARQLHRSSRRAEGPFVAINCAMMAPERMEVELFGVEIGHAEHQARKVGLFEQAHLGTLFFDQVSDMPLETQAKIVRVLQDQTFVRVGGTQPVHVDVRVIGATSKDLQAAIVEGQFREDLYYRLNVVPLRVPPLTERRDDIPSLIDHFVCRAADSSGLQSRRLGPDAMAALQAYPWPGNVRQLRNFVEWMLIMAPGDAGETVTAEALPLQIGGDAPAAASWQNGIEMIGLPLRDAREEFERQYLRAQIARFGGNISRTAEFVRMERSALHRKLKALGLHGGDHAPEQALAEH